MKDKDFSERIFQNLFFSCTLAATWVIKEKSVLKERKLVERGNYFFIFTMYRPRQVDNKRKNFIVGQPVQAVT